MSKITFFSGRTIVVSILVVAILLIAGTAVYGALYDIYLDDSSVTDWSGVPVFQTDPVGDASPPDEDIINAWVASGEDDDLYFMVETNGPTAISANGDKAIVASIDCNDNGDGDDAEDRITLYYPGPDNRFTCEGNGNRCYSPDNDGQRVGSFLEWKVPEDQIPPDFFHPDQEDNCQNDISIRFLLIDTSTTPATVIDETTPFKGWDIPNDVSVLALEARQDSGLLVLSVAAAMLFVGVTLVIYRLRKSA